MGIGVSRVYETLRQEGVNCGLPMTFIELGLGTDYQRAEDFVGEMLGLANCKWICIKGEDTTQAGMGMVVRGLYQCHFSIEMEVSSRRKDPSWLSTVTKWVVTFEEDGIFNYGVLRGGDMIKFVVRNADDFEVMKAGFADTSKTICNRYIKFEPEMKEKKEKESLAKECINFIKRFERARMH